MPDIFLSYARSDKGRIQPLVAALEQRGWSVWWDHTILAGKTWDREIEAALDNSRCVIAAWSKAAVESDWVRTEAAEGKRRGILVPVLLENIGIPLAFRSIHAANLVGWRGEVQNPQLEDLFRAVQGVLGAPSPTAKASMPAAGAVKINPKDNLPYVWIPPGKFMIGCSSGDAECDDREKPAHEVTISRGFWLSQTPITQAAYTAVTGKPNPSHFKGANLPVESVSWDDAKFYSEAIGMRLPTEAEWEYAARAGNTAARYGELADIAWYDGNSGGKTHPVAEKSPNAWGFYDTLGNVWEWCSDWYGADGGRKDEKYKVLRGSSWFDNPRYLRVSYRYWSAPASRNVNIGFRCSGELP